MERNSSDCVARWRKRRRRARVLAGEKFLAPAFDTLCDTLHSVTMAILAYRLYKCKKNCSLSTTYNGEMTHRKQQQIMNGDIALEALRQCQRASKVISLFIIFAVFDVSFRRYKLWINYSFLHLYLLFYYRGSNVECRSILVR